MPGINQYVRYGTSNMVLPKGGPITIPQTLDFNTAAFVSVNLVQAGITEIIDSVQCLFIDNSANSTILSCVVGRSGQRIVVRPNSQGYYPILFNLEDGELIFVTTPLANRVINIHLLNVPIPGCNWQSI